MVLESIHVESLRIIGDEYVDIPLAVSDNDQNQNAIPDIVQEATLNQDNVIEPPIQVQEVILEEQTL